MNNKLYDMIFKRKSFHLFRNIGNLNITDDELNDIENEFYKLIPLVSDIKVKIKINKSSYRGAEYQIEIYSEVKDNYLNNVGYLGEQLDLYLVSKNIGTLWYGIGKVDNKTIDGMDFTIMILIAKIDSDDKFRKDMYKSKRKDLSIVWYGDYYKEIGNIVRYSPSACNQQPWYVESSSNELIIHRVKNGRGIMPLKMILYYSQIDIGIFLCILDLCLNKNNIKYNRDLFIEDSNSSNHILCKYNIID